MPVPSKVERRKATPSDELHERLRKAVCVPTRRCLWVPEDAIEFVPALSDTVYGDGRALLGITTCNSRPAFYVIRIDSTWQVGMDWSPSDDAPEIMEFVDAIVGDLEDQFGPARCECECGDCPEYREWPALDDDGGTMWWRKDWPAGFRVTSHPYSSLGNLLQP